MPHYTTKKLKRRNSRYTSNCCASIGLIKCMLHIYNIVFLMAGIAIFGVAIWTIFWKLEYASLLASATYQVGTYALSVAGGLAILGGVLGCCGIFYEQKATILCYTFLLVLVFLLEIIIGGLSYFYETQIETELQRTFNETILKHYAIDETRTTAIDRMQQEYKCCGAIRFEDWRASEWLTSNRKTFLRPKNGHVVPDSCCISQLNNCGRRDHPSNIPYTGCIYQFSDDLRNHLTIIAAAGLGISLIHIIGIILSCCLYLKLKDPDD